MLPMLSMARKTRSGSPKTRDPEAVARFIERFALVMESSGMPRMPSRVFAALLCADGGRLSAAALAEALGVSRAAISGAVRYLTHTAVVHRERERGARVDLYSVDGELWLQTFAQRDATLGAWERSMAEGVSVLGRSSPAGERLEESRRFFEFLRRELPALMEKWKRVRRASSVVAAPIDAPETARSKKSPR